MRVDRVFIGTGGNADMSDHDAKPAVFISWGYGSDAWTETVEAFVEGLNESGEVTAKMFHPAELEGAWTIKVDAAFKRSDSVIIVLDHRYLDTWERIEAGEEGEDDRGVGHEIRLIADELPAHHDKFVVAILQDAVGRRRLPGTLRTIERFPIQERNEARYARLLRHIRTHAERHGPPAIQVALSHYLYSELDHSIGAYEFSNKRLASALDTLREPQTTLEHEAKHLTEAARELNHGLCGRHAVPTAKDEDRRHPKPPTIGLDENGEALIGRFYAVARKSVESAAPTAAFQPIHDALLLGRSQERQDHLMRRYGHRGELADSILEGSDARRERQANAAREFVSACVEDDRRGVIPGYVLRCLAEAHMNLHQVEHHRSLPLGKLLAREGIPRTKDGTDDDKALLRRSVTLNTFTYSICETLTWIFATERERRIIQAANTEPDGTREGIWPAAPVWLARQVELLSLYRRAHGYRLLGDHQRAYNDLRKLQRIGRALRTRLAQPPFVADEGDPDAAGSDLLDGTRKTAFVETLDALAEYRIGELYRADHDYMQALVHLCRSHDRIETQTAFGWDAADRALVEISLRVGKGKAFFEIGSFKRALKWFAKAWLSLLDLISTSAPVELPDEIRDLLKSIQAAPRRDDVAKLKVLLRDFVVADAAATEVAELIRYLEHVKHEADVDKGLLREKAEAAFEEIRKRDIPAKHRALAADILQRIGHVATILRLEEVLTAGEAIGDASEADADDSRFVEDLLRRAAKLDPGNLLVKTGIIRCELRGAKRKPSLGDPMLCWTSGASDVDQAIRAGEHVMLEQLAREEHRARSETAQDGQDAPENADPPVDLDEAARVTVARKLGEHFMTHTDSINLRGAVQHLYLTRARAEDRDAELADVPTKGPYLEFVCLRRFGCVTPFMPRPAAVSAVGGGYLVRVCWPDPTVPQPSADALKSPVVFNILVDPGEGVVNNLYSVGLGVADIDMVVATHDHPDHITALDALVSLRGEHERIGGEGPAATASRSKMVILGNRSVHTRYGFLNGGGKYTVQHIKDASFLLPDLASKHLEQQQTLGKHVMPGTMLTMTPLQTEHEDHGGNHAVGFVLEFGVPEWGRPFKIAFMSDTGISALRGIEPVRTTVDESTGPDEQAVHAVGDGIAVGSAKQSEEQRRWQEALASDIVVAHVSDVPSDEIRWLAQLTSDDGVASTSFDDGVKNLAANRAAEAERLMHALSIAARVREPKRLVPEPLLTSGFEARIGDPQHLYLHGLLRVAELMKQPRCDRGDDESAQASCDPGDDATPATSPTRVLVIGEFREELGSFRGTIAREINRSVFSPGHAGEKDPSAPASGCRAVTADIGLRIRLGNENARNRVLCSTCSLNNDRLDVERFHPPEEMREVCVKGDHEAMYWSCSVHDPTLRKPSVFVEQMGGYDPFSAGGRYHG